MGRAATPVVWERLSLSLSPRLLFSLLSLSLSLYLTHLRGRHVLLFPLILLHHHHHHRPPGVCLSPSSRRHLLQHRRTSYAQIRDRHRRIGAGFVFLKSLNMSSEHAETPLADAVADKYHDLPASTPSEAAEETFRATKARLFNRERSLHQILGGGKAADTFLWRDKLMSAGILGGASVLYILFEYVGYTFLTILANVLLITLLVLFLWSNLAVFLNRSPPPLPNLHVSEEAATSLALALRDEINRVLAIGHDIALGKDYKRFLKVMAVLWGLSVVGGWFHFLTLVYLVVLASHTIPVVYEKYEDQIDLYAKKAYDQAHKQYKKADETFLKKIFNAAPKFKKTE